MKNSIVENGVVFRGHHRVDIQYLLLDQIKANNTRTNGDIAQTHAQNLLSRLLGHVHTPISSWHKVYGTDIVGYKAEHAEQFLSFITQGYLHFLSLSDEATVEFNTRPDLICGACLEGSHCLKPIQSEADIIEIQHLVDLCKKRKIKHKVVEKKIPSNARFGKTPVPTRVVMPKSSFIQVTAREHCVWRLLEESN